MTLAQGNPTEDRKPPEITPPEGAKAQETFASITAESPGRAMEDPYPADCVGIEGSYLCRQTGYGKTWEGSKDFRGGLSGDRDMAGGVQVFPMVRGTCSRNWWDENLKTEGETYCMRTGGIIMSWVQVLVPCWFCGRVSITWWNLQCGGRRCREVWFFFLNGRVLELIISYLSP